MKLSIKAKLAAGFGFIVVCVVVTGVIGYLAISRSSSGFNTYRGLARETNLGGRLQAHALDMRIAATRFLQTLDEKDVETYRVEKKQAEAFLAEAEAAMADPARLEKLARVKTNMGLYDAGFEEIVTKARAATRTLDDVLNVQGEAVHKVLAKLTVDATRNRDTEVAITAGQAAQHLLLARLNIFKYISTADEAEAARVLQEFKALERELATLLALMDNDGYREMLAAARKGYAEYKAGYDSLHQNLQRVEELKEGVIYALGPTFARDVEEVELSIKAEQDELGPKLQASNERTVTQIALIVAGAVLVSLIAAVFIGLSIIRPTRALTNAASVIGKGDFAAELPREADFSGELLTLRQALGNMLAAILKAMGEANEKSAAAEAAQKKAEAAMGEAAAANARAEAALKEGITQAAGRLESVVEGLSSASEELSAQIDQSSRGADIQSSRVGETATAMEQMNATVLEVAKNASEAATSSASAREQAQEGAQVVRRVVGSISDAQKQAIQLKDNMVSLGQKVEAIGRIMEVISDIADQTNLLALNAAIEAARAGDAGRGFAVVADEVRKLAEKTMAATKEVGASIGDIQNGARQNLTGVDEAVRLIDQATALAHTAGESLTKIVAIVDTATDQVRSIAASSEEQSAASEQINQAVEEIRRISEETSQAMGESSRAVMDLARQSQSLQSLIQDMRSA